MPLLENNEAGLYCAAGDFYIDPRRAVERALITHAHSDHARPGAKAYLCASAGVNVLRVRLGKSAVIEGWPYGEQRHIRDVVVSFHPAGHILGSAQIRLEHRGEVWVVSGDFKLHSDPTCSPFEPVRCHTFITEATFGVPAFRWPPLETVVPQLQAWWRNNQQLERTSVLFAYSLGKAQRLLALLEASAGPIFAHAAILRFLPAYQAAGVTLPAVEPAEPATVRATGGRALVLVPPGTARSLWRGEWGKIATAYASGWMLLPSMQRRRGGSARGLVISDHADWPGLIEAVRATGAPRILVDHGYAEPFARWLNRNGWEASPLCGERTAAASVQGELVELLEQI